VLERESDNTISETNDKMRSCQILLVCVSLEYSIGLLAYRRKGWVENRWSYGRTKSRVNCRVESLDKERDGNEVRKMSFSY